MTAKRVAAIVLLFIALGILCALGTWQANRFINKRAIFSRMEERIPQPVVNVSSAPQLAPENMELRRVQLQGGKLLLEKSVGVARRFFKNQPGYWVMTPYVFADGTAIWVQRGWSPQPIWKESATRDEDRTIPVIGLVQHLYVVHPDTVARAALAGGEFRLGELPEVGELDTELLRDALDAAPSPTNAIVVLGEDYAELRGESPPIPTVTHITQPYLTPMTHFGYAFLWYGAAILLCWLFWAGWTGRLDASHRPD